MTFNIKSLIDSFGLGVSVMGIISNYNFTNCCFTLFLFIILLICDYVECNKK